MSTAARIALALTLCVACDREAPARRAASDPTPSANAARTEAKPSSAASATASAAAATASASAAPAPGKPEENGQPRIEGSIPGNFRGKDQASRVLFLDDGSLSHAWDENGAERREPITTEPPPGNRECKLLRSFGAQDFLLCMYWFTGPGGGRVDGVLFDLKRRIRGEFFSAALNLQLLNTLCSPDTMVGPMPSYNMDEWRTVPATVDTDAEVHVTVSKMGWTHGEAASLRKQPATKEYCKCVGTEPCAGAPTPPRETSTIVYRLKNDRLHPTKESEPILKQVAQQWAHNQVLKAWNLKMRKL